MARPLRNDRQIIVAVVVPGRGEPGTHEHGPRQPCGRYPNLAMPDGRMAALRLARGEESPGSTEVRCRVTPGGGDPRESATESTPPACPASTGRAARVKRCGKSAPRRRQRRRQGKPHREQDQVGAAGIPLAGMPGGPSRRRSGRSHEALGNGRPRGMAIPARGPAPQGGTEPGLHAVWRPFQAISMREEFRTLMFAGARKNTPKPEMLADFRR